MKASHVFAALVGGGVAAAIGYVIGAHVGFDSGVRTAAEVTGHDPHEVARAIQRKARRTSGNPRMGD